jgi:hypothetical protein
MGYIAHNLKGHTVPGKWYRWALSRTGLALLYVGRRVLRHSGGLCSWCGRDPGWNSTVSALGLRCDKCSDKP